MTSTAKLAMMTQTETSLSPAECRAMFQQTLTRWAMDVLTLRRLGLDRPSFRSIDAVDEGSDDAE
jgi:hypothetical protein